VNVSSPYQCVNSAFLSALDMIVSKPIYSKTLEFLIVISE
jgi:hypothetical protein